jgi:hypothetical protein
VSAGWEQQPDGSLSASVLTRAKSANTAANLDNLKEFINAKAEEWAESGGKPSVADISRGHTLVYEVCSSSTAPRDAEFHCYDMFMDYCRGISASGKSPAEKAAGVKALCAVFKYLDQHYTATKKRPGARTTKQATSKLAAGQPLKFAAEKILADVEWLPDFYLSAGAATTSSAPPQTAPPPPRAASPPKPAAPSTAEAMQHRVAKSREVYKDEVEQRIAAARAEVDADPMGFERYLRSRAGVHDPRLSQATFAANAMMREPASTERLVAESRLAAMSGNYAGSRLDPFFHGGVYAAPRAAPRSMEDWHAAAYARVEDPRDVMSYRGPMGAAAPFYSTPYGGARPSYRPHPGHYY